MVTEPVSSLDLSPLGEFLVTSHVDDVGVYLWSNMALYTHVDLRPLPANFEPHTLELPSTHIVSQGADVGVRELKGCSCGAAGSACVCTMGMRALQLCVRALRCADWSCCAHARVSLLCDAWPTRLLRASAHGGHRNTCGQVFLR